MKRSRLSTLAVAACTCLALVGCSAAGTEEAADSADTSQRPQSGAVPGGGAGGPGGATSGLVAERTGTTLQVQGNGTQTAVSFDDETTLTQQVDGEASDLAEGQCVMVRLDAEDDAVATSVNVTSTDGDCAGAMGGPRGDGEQAVGEPDETGAVSASSLSLSTAVDGECRGQGGPGGMPGTTSGAPEERES